MEAELQSKPDGTVANRQQRYQMAEANWLLPQQTSAKRNGDLGSAKQPDRPDSSPNPWVRRGEPEGDMASHGSPSPGAAKRGARRGLTEPLVNSSVPDEARELRPDQTEAAHPAEPAEAQCLEAPQPATATKKMGLLRIIRTSFITYCQCTTLRGLPKIVKTKDKLLKYIWIVFTTAFFLGCFTCLALIVNQYLAYDVIHQPRTVRNHPVQFPSFTVCNTRPLSQEGIEFIRSRNMMLPKQYYSYVMNASKNTLLNMRLKGAANAMEFNTTIRHALSTIFDNKGYFENIPAGINTTYFGHTLDQTILICDSTILINDFKESRFCEVIGTWTRTYDNKFLNCYTFTAHENLTKQILTVRIMAYTNERNLTYCPDCSSFPATQVSGLRVQLHNAGNYPEVQEEGLNIKPGSLTEIRFDTKQWIMKEEPHGSCSKTVPPSMQFSHSNFTYSYEACKKKVLHEQIMRTCGCLDSTIPLPDSMLDTGLHYCGRLPQSQFSLFTNSSVIEDQESARRNASQHYSIDAAAVHLPSFINNAEFRDFLRRITCNMETFKVASKLTKSPCFTPCTYYTYLTTISTTNWPTRAYLYEIVEDFHGLKQRIDGIFAKGNMARNSSYLDPVYKRLRQVYGPRRGEAEQKSPRETDYIQNNFMEILINRAKSSSFEIEKIEEKAVISLTSLLSQIGGLLSIWVGLTFVCIVEIVDMIYNIVTMYSQQSRMPEANQ